MKRFFNWLTTSLDPATKPEESLAMLNRQSIVILVFGVVIVLLYGADYSSKATIFLWMLACWLSGGAIGFLFGIPKILQNNTVSGAASGATIPAYQQQVNTNLTEISDWLTKIIVGLGLVNLTKIPPYLAKIARILADGLSIPGKPPTPLAFAFAYGTILTYAILGFLFGYLITRLYLAAAFFDADTKSMIRKTEEAVGAANSALQKAEFALLKPSEISQDSRQTPEQKLEDLAQTYVRTRNNMSPGSARTTRMAEIFKSMMEVSTMINDFDISAALSANDIGKRLTGYAFLYVKPQWDRRAELIEALISDSTPFGQYWAIQALGKTLATQSGGKLEPDLYTKIKTYYESLPRGIDREYELRKLFPELNK